MEVTQLHSSNGDRVGCERVGKLVIYTAQTGYGGM
jgi:hypothetical protein